MFKLQSFVNAWSDLAELGSNPTFICSVIFSDHGLLVAIGCYGYKSPAEINEDILYQIGYHSVPSINWLYGIYSKECYIFYEQKKG